MRMYTMFPDPSDPSIESMVLEVELWRADMATSIIDLDASGRVLSSEEDIMSELYPPGLPRGSCRFSL